MAKGCIGLDEAGRGALAGPVFVGACFLPEDPRTIIEDILQEAGVKALKDSKKLTPAQRERIFESNRFYFLHKTGWANPDEIDCLGIVGAVSLAAKRAIDVLEAQIGNLSGAVVRADAGLFHPYEERFATERFVKGDELYPEISLASVAAKVGRDRMMALVAETFPGYGFEVHKGYGTAAHLAAIRERGPAPAHRALFIRNVIGHA